MPIGSFSENLTSSTHDGPVAVTALPDTNLHFPLSDFGRLKFAMCQVGMSRRYGKAWFTLVQSV